MICIPRASKPIEDVDIELYTSFLPISMEMFVKNVDKATLEGAFQEALKVEKNMMSLEGNPRAESSKDKGKVKSIVSKPTEENNNSNSMDMEALQRIVKKLPNDLIDLKKSGREGSSS
jgi:hypothetical protein